MSQRLRKSPVIIALALIVGCTGCHGVSRIAYVAPVPAPNPLGYASDPIWQRQEANAEASDFVIYEHEFIQNTARLNTAGEDHVKEIAMRAPETPFAVVVERSMTTAREHEKYKYPVHVNPQLDSMRREMVVQLLSAMGVHDADDRVLVAPALAEGFESIEAERAYYQGIYGAGGRQGGFLGGGGGIGGGGLGGGAAF